MAFFSANPTATGGTTSIVAASAGRQARFLAFGYSNDTATRVTLRIYDGTVASGTLRVRISLAPGDNNYIFNPFSGGSIFPKSWWSSGNAIQCDLDGAGSVFLFGDVVQE